MVLTTTAIMPASALTTPLRLIWSIARQRLPVLQPEPTILRFTTGLTNGSRRPVRLITLGACSFASLVFFLSSTAIFCFGCAGLRTAAALAFGTAALVAGWAATLGAAIT